MTTTDWPSDCIPMVAPAGRVVHVVPSGVHDGARRDHSLCGRRLTGWEVATTGNRVCATCAGLFGWLERYRHAMHSQEIDRVRVDTRSLTAAEIADVLHDRLDAVRARHDLISRERDLGMRSDDSAWLLVDLLSEQFG